MRTSQKGIEIIKAFEGFRKRAYRCSANKLTIGYGHLIRIDEEELENKEITKEEGENILEKDIKHCEEYLNKIIKENNIELRQNEYDVLISFIYNTGYLKEAMIERIKNNKIRDIGEALVLYNKANGAVLQGLTRRRKKEQELFFS